MSTSISGILLSLIPAICVDHIGQLVLTDRDGLFAQWAGVLLLDPGRDALGVEDVLDVAGHLADHGLPSEFLLANGALHVELTLVLLLEIGDSAWRRHEICLRVAHCSIVEIGICDYCGGLLGVGNFSLLML